MTTPPIILWFRRDLRLADHEALAAACRTDQPVIPVFICDTSVERLGAAPQWRLGLALEQFAKTLHSVGSALILRRGDPRVVLDELVNETGATAVYWSRLYDPASQERDSAIKAALKAKGTDACSFASHLLFEPWTVQTGQGTPYRVYSPYWRAVRDRGVPAPLPAPTRLKGPDVWPKSADLNSWDLGNSMRRGGPIVAEHVDAGAESAMRKLQDFSKTRVATYKAQRDFPAIHATSDMSQHLTVGEISARQCWAAGCAAQEEGAAGAEHFLKELVWREFAWHLTFHTPHLLTENWRETWHGFEWNEDESRPEVLAWKQGRTGVPFVDAAMRELYVTGRMHNRARMIVASYLTKHLMTHWRIGQSWFEDCLIDWDPASNAMGWQWVAGCGPDAAPYFRIFNPQTQREKFDPGEVYLRRWLAEPYDQPSATALSFFEAIPRSWALHPKEAYPAPVVTLSEGRNRALFAYETWRKHHS